MFVSYFISVTNHTVRSNPFRVRYIFHEWSNRQFRNRITHKTFPPQLDIAARIIIIDFDDKMNTRKCSFGWHNLISSIQNRSCPQFTVLKRLTNSPNISKQFQWLGLASNLVITSNVICLAIRNPLTKVFRRIIESANFIVWQHSSDNETHPERKSGFLISNRGWTDCQNVNQLLIIITLQFVGV